MKITGQTVLVTGANRGIGRALVQALLQRQVKKVYATARDVSTLEYQDPRVEKLQLDITNPEQVKRAAESAGDVTLLINNAGVATVGNFSTSAVDDIRTDMDVNYYGTLAVIRAFLPALREKPEASIVNVASIAAFANLPLIAGYSASKTAVFSLSQGLRTELAPAGIAVHTVNPGPIDTDMARDFPQKTPAPVAADNILMAIENDIADIFPDPASEEMFAAWRSDYRNLEKIFYDMTYAA